MADPSVATETLIAGFEQARARYVDAAPHRERRDEAFFAMFEVVAWVGTVGGRLLHEGQSLSPEMSGVYHVRNLTIHYGADALERAIVTRAYGEGVYGEGTYGGVTDYGWRWRPRHELPPPVKTPSPTVVAAYDSHLDGRDPADTFDSISRFLAT